MLSDHLTNPYYRAAAVGLRALEHREARNRRFGPDADATWSLFADTLTAADRLQLLLRDAAAAWHTAFSPNAIFGIPGVATDEPFGPGWAHAQPARLDGNLLDPAGPATLADAAEALGVRKAKVALPELTPSTRLCVGGGAAILAVAEAFAARDDLSWEHQLVFVADDPAHRQLAGLAAIFAGSEHASDVRRSADAPDDLPRLLSADAEPTVAALEASA
jgi:hypothetical protein